MTKKVGLNATIMEQYKELTDEELMEINGGTSLANQLLQIYNSIWPNDTAWNTGQKSQPTTAYNPYAYWY